MPAYIHDIAVCVPEFFNHQRNIRELMKKHLAKDRRTSAIIHRIYAHSGIQKRHSVLEDFSEKGTDGLFFNGTIKANPGTASRSKIYEEQAKILFCNTAKALLHQNPHISKESITHLITVSCTGFFAPGPDFEIVKSLGLNADIQRFHIGFMGCCAAFPALKMAEAFCVANSDACVLIICGELCTLHFQNKTEIDNLLSASVFADGAAGVLVSGRPSRKKHLKIEKLTTLLAQTGESDMTWKIGDTGFDMTLSTYVPDIIKNNLADVIQPFYDEFDVEKDNIDFWAIHPGGRAILDKIEHSLNLEPDQLAASRKTLAEYGNMSSATVLFVLKEVFGQQARPGQRIMAMAFGPGLTIESGLLCVRHPSN